MFSFTSPLLFLLLGQDVNFYLDFCVSFLILHAILHLQVLEAAKCLHLKEHTVLDEFGNSFKLAGPVECKGIIGSDDR